MSHLVVCPLKHAVQKLMRWAVLILPIFFYGCFDTQSMSKQSARGSEAGISSVSRFFLSGREDSSAKPSAAVKIQTQVPSTYSLGFSAVPELAEEVSENTIAIPAYIGIGENGPESSFKRGYTSRASTGLLGHEHISSFQNAVSLVFNTPFNRIFSKVFKQTKSDDVTQIASNDVTQIAKDELPNPFTEARLKQESSAAEEGSEEASDVKATAIENKADSTDQTPKEDSNSEDSSKAASNNPVTPVLPILASANEGFLIIGNFDGSGTLQATSAQRLTDTHFISEDGERDFNLRINPAAAEEQRSFYIDDINMDGNRDILVTGPISLYGGVFLGDGAGGYRLTHRFFTGYEPTIPCAGPLRNGMREIVAIGANSGLMRTYQYVDKYRTQQAERLDFIPNYLLHLVAPDTSLEFVMAAQIGGTEQILEWKDDGLIKPTTDQLGADAAVLGGDFGSYSLVGYQVGNYASVVLTRQGISFNVANMRILPGSYLIIGDLRRQGTTDVAVADLISFIPFQNNR